MKKKNFLRIAAVAKLFAIPVGARINQAITDNFQLSFKISPVGLETYPNPLFH